MNLGGSFDRQVDKQDRCYTPQPKVILLLIYQIFILRSMLEEQQIKQDILKNHPKWTKISADDIKLTRMEGITNLTYKAEVKGDQKLYPIIYRKFGESNENIFLSRDEEQHIYAELSQTGDGPHIYYYDNSIRLEQFLDSTVHKTENMLRPGYLQNVAYTLANFHNIKPKSEKISRVSLIQKTFIDNRDKMLDKVRSKLDKKIYTTEEQQLCSSLKEWASEDTIKYVEGVLKSLEGQPLVFSHNDLLPGNVLIRKDNNKYVFIDYEYSSYNYDFYDIANYFQESLIDYDVKQPPYFTLRDLQIGHQQMKTRFIDAYVISKDYHYKQYREKFDELRKEEKYIKERERIQRQLVIGRLLCSLMWGWWAIIVSKNEHIKFDYIKFAKWRQENYNLCKEQLQKK